MPECVLAFLVLPLEELYGGILADGTREVVVMAVDLDCEHVLRQAGTDAFSYVEGRRARFELTDRAVGESYVDH